MTNWLVIFRAFFFSFSELFFIISPEPIRSPGTMENIQSMHHAILRNIVFMLCTTESRDNGKYTINASCSFKIHD